MIYPYMLVISSNCFAWSNDTGIYKALHENHQNYIYYGYTGSEGTLYIDKSLIQRFTTFYKNKYRITTLSMYNEGAPITHKRKGFTR